MSWFTEEDEDVELPWLVKAEEDEEYTFIIDVDSVTKAKNEKKWSCYMVKMTDILDSKDKQHEEDGKHEIPFWAMKAFKAAVAIGMTDVEDDDVGYLPMTYSRIEGKKGNKAVFRCI